MAILSIAYSRDVISSALSFAFISLSANLFSISSRIKPIFLQSSNEKYVLDEDELEEALENKMIGKEEYNLAYDTLHRLEEKYKSQKEINKLMDIMQGYLNIMTEKIKDKEIIYTNV